SPCAPSIGTDRGRAARRTGAPGSGLQCTREVRERRGPHAVEGAEVPLTLDQLAPQRLQPGVLRGEPGEERGVRLGRRPVIRGDVAARRRRVAPQFRAHVARRALQQPRTFAGRAVDLLEAPHLSCADEQFAQDDPARLRHAVPHASSSRGRRNRRITSQITKTTSAILKASARSPASMPTSPITALSTIRPMTARMPPAAIFATSLMGPSVRTGGRCGRIPLRRLAQERFTSRPRRPDASRPLPVRNKSGGGLVLSTRLACSPHSPAGTTARQDAPIPGPAWRESRPWFTARGASAATPGAEWTPPPTREMIR